jgi:6-phosphogluconolactonase
VISVLGIHIATRTSWLHDDGSVETRSMHVRVLIGTYTRGTASEGIYVAEWSEQSGRLEQLRLATRADNPSLVVWSKQHRRVYAVLEVTDYTPQQEGAIACYELNGFRLTSREYIPSGGGLPCALAFDRGERRLAVANYAGSVALIELTPNGTFGAQRHAVRHTRASVHPRRQREAHPHGVTFIGGELWVPDLGGDAVYRYGGTTLEASRVIDAPAGSGPRLLIGHPTLPVCYLVHELGNEVGVLSRAPEPRYLQRITTLAAGFDGRSAASDIHLSADGRFLYVTNRGEDSIVGYAIGDSGELAVVTRIATRGTHPRAFALSPGGEWLLVANRDSSTVTVFRRDAASGALSDSGFTLDVPAPASLSFVES